MEKAKLLFITTCMLFGAHAQSLALDTVDGTQADLYSLERDGDKFIRLNKKTGQLTVCRFDDEELICRLASDERDALLNEIETLSKLVDELSSEKQKDSAENNHTKQENKDSELDAEIDRAIDYSSKIMRRFFETMKDLREDFKKETQ